jgi:hypothetical protein
LVSFSGARRKMTMVLFSIGLIAGFILGAVTILAGVVVAAKKGTLSEVRPGRRAGSATTEPHKAECCNL